MKYTITINQSAIFTNGMINKTDLVDWAIIDYLKDFVIYKKAKKIIYENEEYVWLNYNHLITSLPLANLKYKPKVTVRINKLRSLGLIKTVKNVDNTLYCDPKVKTFCIGKFSSVVMRSFVFYPGYMTPQILPDSYNPNCYAHKVYYKTH